MAGWISGLVLVVSATVIALAESRAIPAEPISVMIDPYGNPIVFLREKRTPVNPYPQRAMMFTGYYRPVRRSGGGGSQATGVFAQGNAVSGEAFFGPEFHQGPEPIEEQEVSSAEAEASPDDESINETGDNDEEQTNFERPEHHHDRHDHHEQHEQHEQHDYHHDTPDVHQHHEPEVHRQHEEPEVYHEQEEGQHNQQDNEREHEHRHEEPQEQEPEPAAVQPEVPAEAPQPATTVATVNRPKTRPAKKPKRPVIEEEDEDEEYDEDEPVVPFVPFNKGNRRRQNYPNLNNFFPMIFSFPGATRRDGTSGSGSPPGAVTAIANSYSTGKGGVASSVATAYGGSPNGKKRRNPPPQAEE